MHELAVTESILEISLRHAREAGAARIARIHLVLGELSSIVDDSVQFYWDMISENTLAEGAQLVFRRVPVELLCLSCAQRYSPNGNELACPSCGAAQVKIIAGEEFYVEAIDVQMEDSKEAK
jgi:hydrogenase nickel incorporation protein HypA/HybF